MQSIDEDELKRFIGVRRSKIGDDGGFLALVPFADVLDASKTEANRETRALMDLGMPVGVSLKEARANIFSSIFLSFAKLSSDFSFLL